MDAPAAHDLFEFAGFCLDRCSGGLFRRGAAGDLASVPIFARADVLGVLVSRPGELLSKQAIMQAVWPGMVVDEKNLTVQIATLRRVLDDERKDRSCIQTEAGRGYRFVAPVTGRSGTSCPGEEFSADPAGCDTARRGGRTAVWASTAVASSPDSFPGGGGLSASGNTVCIGLDRRVDRRRRGAAAAPLDCRVAVPGHGR